MKVLPYLKRDSLVFIHDFFSRVPHYSPLLKYYDEVGRVLAYRNFDLSLGPIDEPQGLIVLRKSEQAINISLTADEIDRIYESTDWHYPFGPPLTSLYGYYQYLLTFLTLSKWKRARSASTLSQLVKKDMWRMLITYFLFSLVAAIFRKFLTSTMSSICTSVRTKEDLQGPPSVSSSSSQSSCANITRRFASYSVCSR